MFPAAAAPTWVRRQLVPRTKVRPFPPRGGPGERLRFEILRESGGCCQTTAHCPLMHLMTSVKSLSFSGPQFPFLGNHLDHL